MPVAASLSIKLGLLTATFAEDSDKARAALSRLQLGAQNVAKQFSGMLGPIKQFGSLLGGIGLISLAQQAITLADNTVELAKGFDISTAKVLQFKDALILSGGDGSKFEQILSKLYVAVDKAAQGDEVLITKFQRLGISFKELSTLSPEAAINRVTKALADNSDGFNKVALARELFGKSAAGIDFGRLSEELAKNTEQYAENAKNLENLKNVHDNIQRSLVNLQVAFASFFPTFAEGTISVADFEKAIKTLLIYFSVAKVLALAVAVFELSAGFKAAATFAKGLEFVLSSGKIGLILGAIALAVAGVSLLLDLYFEKVEKAKKDAFIGPPSSAAKAATPALTPEEIKAKEELAAKAREEVASAQVKYNTTVKLIELEERRLNTAIKLGNASDLQRKFVELEFESEKKILELTLKEAEIRKVYKDKDDVRKLELAANAALVAAEKERLRLAKELYVATVSLTLEKETQALNDQANLEGSRSLKDTPAARARAAIEAKRQNAIRDIVGTPSGPDGEYSEGQQKIIDWLNARAEAELRILDIQGKRLFLGIALNAEDADAAESLVKDLEVLGQKNAAAFAVFKGIAIAQALIDTWGAAQKQFNAFSFFPPLAYAAAGIAIAAGLARVAQIRAATPTGRASGGRIVPGTDYLVGESGVEAFRSDVPGTIIPNGKTEEMMKGGGGGITIINNPGSTFDERVLQNIMSNMKLISGTLIDENQRRLAPAYAATGAG